MVILRIILIIAFFLVLLCKPTYLKIASCVEVNEDTEEEAYAIILTRTPLFMALIFRYWFGSDCLFMNRTAYEVLAEKLNQTAEEGED